MKMLDVEKSWKSGARWAARAETKNSFSTLLDFNIEYRITEGGERVSLADDDVGLGEVPFAKADFKEKLF